ncbi:MAG: hypothetical protein KDC35_19130 [Acidobacteria bacterium]|nr:hypothetical protein [Acidobacteriota bacterium]
MPIKRIGEILLDSGIISESQLEGALMRQRSRGGRLGENLVATGAVDKDELMRILAQRTGVAEIHLMGVDIKPDVLALIPREVAERFNVIPLSAPSEKSLEIACSDPSDLEALDNIAFITDRKIIPFLAPYDEIQTAIRRYYLGIQMTDSASDYRKVMEQQHGRKRLGELLVEAGMITPSQLLGALNRQRKWGGILGENLVAISALTEADLMRFLSQRIHVSEIDLNTIEPKPEALKRVSRAMCERYNIAPIDMGGPNQLVVACSDPTDLNMLDQVAFITGMNIKPVLASYQAINAFIGRHYLADRTGHDRLHVKRNARVAMEDFGGHAAVEDPDIIIFGNQE